MNKRDEAAMVALRELVDNDCKVSIRLVRGFGPAHGPKGDVDDYEVTVSTTEKHTHHQNISLVQCILDARDRAINGVMTGSDVDE